MVPSSHVDTMMYVCEFTCNDKSLSNETHHAVILRPYDHIRSKLEIKRRRAHGYFSPTTVTIDHRQTLTVDKLAIYLAMYVNHLWYLQ